MKSSEFWRKSQIEVLVCFPVDTEEHQEMALEIILALENLKRTALYVENHGGEEDAETL